MCPVILKKQESICFEELHVRTNFVEFDSYVCGISVGTKELTLPNQHLINLDYKN